MDSKYRIDSYRQRSNGLHNVNWKKALGRRWIVNPSISFMTKPKEIKNEDRNLITDIRLYSTKRLYDAIKRGHDTEVVSYLVLHEYCKAKPRIFSAGRD